MKTKKLEFKNLSNGITDGIVFFYMKDKMLYPILLDKEQCEMLDIMLLMAFSESQLRIAPTPVEYEAIKEMIVE